MTDIKGHITSLIKLAYLILCPHYANTVEVCVLLAYCQGLFCDAEASPWRKLCECLIMENVELLFRKSLVFELDLNGSSCMLETFCPIIKVPDL